MACGLFPACAPDGTIPGPQERVNLILISLDTCRADRMSCYGAERQNTPALDAFAEEAVQFNDCLAQSALTAPSHMSMLTGHFVHRHGLLNNQGSITPKYSLASHLSALGWRTAAFTGHGSFQAKHGLDLGFEVFESAVGEMDSSLTRDFEEVVPSALEWLDRIEEESFFLLLHSYDPHCPFWAPDPWREKYTGWYQGAFAPELQELCHPRRFGEKMQAGIIGREELRYIDDMYDAGVAAADVAIGSFLQELERRDLLDKSIVVFTSDHGEVLGNHGWIGHGQVWEEALQVPLLVRYPDGEWARTIDEPVQHVDLVPTLLSSMGLPDLPGLQGVDLLPLVRGDLPELSEDRMRLARVGDTPNQVAVRFGTRWKAVFEEREEGVSQARLFDLKEDPLEQENLIGTKDGRERFDRIAQRYFKWRSVTKDDDGRYGGTKGLGLTSDEDLQMLRDLGYMGDGSDPASGGGE